MKTKVDYDLDAFDKGEEMAEIRAGIGKAADKGEFCKGLLYNELGDGTTHHGLMAATLLREHGFQVEFSKTGIVVKW